MNSLAIHTDTSDIPAGAFEVPTINKLERRRFNCSNGSTFVLLHDESEEGWESYCKMIAKGGKL